MMKSFDTMLTVVGLFFMSEGFAALLSSDAGGEDVGSPAIRLLGLAIGLLSVLRLMASPGALRSVLHPSLAALAPVIVAIASIAWSTNPGAVLQRAGALALSSAFALFIVTRYDARGLMNRVLAALALYCLLSLVLIFFFPSMGVHTAAGTLFAEHIGAWRGLSPFKNDFGRIAAYAGVVFGAMVIARRRHRWLYAAGAALAGVLVLGSRSGQAAALLASCWIAIAALALLMTLPRPQRSAFLIVIGPLALLAAMSANTIFAASLEVLGKDASLTGRSEIWPVVMRSMEGNLLLGGGYGAGWDALVANEIYKAFGRAIGHAHNGYLNLVVDIGLVGLSTTLAFGVLLAGRIYAALSRDDNAELVLFAFATLVFIVAGNWVASFLLKHNSLFWVLLVCLYCEFGKRARAPASRAREPSYDLKVQVRKLEPGV